MILWNRKKYLPLHSLNASSERAAPEKLPCGVMVARRILVPPVRVRILPRQQTKELKLNVSTLLLVLGICMLYSCLDILA